jgi:ABC-type phosphate/phosphonate transport system substrate-binding protein
VRRWVRRNRVGTALIVSLCTGLAVALVLLELALARQKKLDLHRANSVQRFSREVEEMWKDKQRQFVLIHSPDLAELADLPPRQADVLTTRLTFGISINHEPLGQAMQYAPFLSALERRMEKALHRAVLIDLRLSKSEANSVRDTARGELDVQRIGAYLYVLSKQASPGLEPIARERGRKDAVVFASKDSGITNLVGLAGKRFAFGETNSVMSFWAKVHLVRAGIRGSNLQSYVHINAANRGRDEDASGSKLSQDRDAEIQSHKRVIQEVLLGRADAGEAPRRHFELSRYKRHGLVPLLVYPVTSDIYVARPGLDPEVARALRECLLSFQGQSDQEYLEPLGHNVLTEGFDPVTDQDFDDLRLAMQNELVEFEGGARK